MFAQNEISYRGYLYWVVSGTRKKEDDFHQLFNEKNFRAPGYIVDFTYYLDGSDEMLADGKTIKSHKDSVIIATRQDSLGYKPLCRTVQDISYINVHFCFDEPFLSEISVIDVSGSPKIKELYIQLNKIWIRRQKMFAIHASVLFFRILEELAYIVEKKSASRLDSVIEYIHKHYIENNFSCKVLPELCGLKHSQFIDLFAKEFGTTPSKYLTTLRLDRATELLTKSSLSIQDISRQVGYENPWYFAKVFKQRFGVSPSKYKSQ